MKVSPLFHAVWIVINYPRRRYGLCLRPSVCLSVSLCVCLSVCVCVCLFFRTISTKSMQLGSPNLTHKCSKCSTMSLENPFGVKRSRSGVTKTLPAWVFALLWVLASSSVASVIIVIEAPVGGRVPEGFPDVVLGVCRSSTLEAAAVEETVPAVVTRWRL